MILSNSLIFFKSLHGADKCCIIHSENMEPYTEVHYPWYSWNYSWSYQWVSALAMELRLSCILMV